MELVDKEVAEEEEEEEEEEKDVVVVDNEGDGEDEEEVVVVDLSDEKEEKADKQGGEEADKTGEEEEEDMDMKRVDDEEEAGEEVKEGHKEDADKKEGVEEEEEDESEEEDEIFIPLAKPKGGTVGTSDGRPPWYRATSATPGFPLKTLHNEILDLCDLLMPTAAEKAKTATAITYVRTVVAATLGKAARVDVFGSQLTGLVLPNSDIDAVVSGGLYDSIGKMNKMGEAIFRRKNWGEVREVTVIKKAKVPLVKFVHASTGIQVDVCFEQPSGLQSGNAAKALMRQMQPVRPLVMVLKAYMGQRKLNETYTGGIGSFLLQLMVVALVQKCGREARAKGHEPPTNLGFYLDEFFDFYGNQLNYASTGITLLGEGGGGFYNKQQLGWLAPARPYTLSMQNPHDTHVDVGTNSFKVDICKLSFKSTSLRLKCAIQRSIASEKRGWGAGSTGGFLKYVVDPGGELRARALPPPLFCTRTFDENSGEAVEDDSEDDVEAMKKALQSKAQLMMAKHGGSSKRSGPSGKSKRRSSGSKQGNAKRRKQTN